MRRDIIRVIPRQERLVRRHHRRPCPAQINGTFPRKTRSLRCAGIHFPASDAGDLLRFCQTRLRCGGLLPRPGAARSSALALLGDVMPDGGDPNRPRQFGFGSGENVCTISINALSLRRPCISTGCSTTGRASSFQSPKRPFSCSVPGDAENRRMLTDNLAFMVSV